MIRLGILASSMIAAVLALAAAPLAIAQPAPPPAGPADPALVGDWSGALPIQPPQHIIFHVREASGGSATTTMDVPERNLTAIPVVGPVRDGGKVEFEIPAVRFRYEAVLDPDGRTLRGTVTQGGAPPLPVIVTRSAPAGDPAASAASGAAWRAPSAGDIRKVLQERIADHHGVGVVVGVLGPDGRSVIYAEGARGDRDSRPLDGETVFEVASISKVLTGLLLADMTERKEVQLDDPAQRILPPDVSVPAFHGRSPTLLDLATHTAGFPGTPPDFDDRSGQVYDLARFDRYVSNYQLIVQPGSQWTYSNIGVALLGQALASKAKTDFSALIADRITGPLGMTSTLATPTAGMMARLTPGHDFALRPAPMDRKDAFEPAWGFYSTADDLLRLLRLQSGEGPQELIRASALTLSARRPIGPGAWQGLGWEAREVRPGGPLVVFKNGGARGYRAYLAFRPDNHAGVVVLTNALTAWSPDDVGLFILAGQPLPPLPPPAPSSEHKAVALPLETLQLYVGRYQLTPQTQVIIGLQDGALFGQLSGGRRVTLYAEAPGRFFATDVDAEVSFDGDPSRRPTGMHLRLNGQEMTAPRLADGAQN
jgi:CubicO group peptidase (beta-lactamase class C family)